MGPVTESELREFVIRTLTPTSMAGPEKVVEEFVVGDQGRIDIAVISDRLTGFELKSDLDTLTRLPRQMHVYSQVFDFCTLVVTQRHLEPARQMLDPAWGLAVVRRNSDMELTYRPVRKARPAKSIDKFSLASLLWRDETLRALDALSLASGLRSQARDVLWARLAEVTTHAELRAIVTQALTARQGWRDVTALRAGVETYQSSGVSSRFLARRLTSQYR